MKTRTAAKPRNRVDLPVGHFTEKEVLSKALSILEQLKVPAKRQNTGAFVIKDKRGKERLVKCGEPGDLDIRGSINGRVFELEIKKPDHRNLDGKIVRSRPTFAQYLRMNKINADGGFAWWTADPDELLTVIPKLRDGGHRVYIAANGFPVLTDGPRETDEPWYVPVERVKKRRASK